MSPFSFRPTIFSFRRIPRERWRRWIPARGSWLLLLLTFPGGGAFLRGGEFVLPEGPVSLDQALRWAIEQDPVLRRIAWEREAAEGHVDQVDRRPNPVVGADVENFLGTGNWQGVDGLEVTVGVSQVFETADKRARRTALAKRERDLVAWDAEERRTVLEAQVRAAFVDVLLAQHTEALRREQLDLARESLRETGRLVDAARASQVEQTRAQLAVRQREFAIRQAEREALAARERLAGLWGLAPTPEFSVVGELRLEAPPDLIEMVTRLARTAPLARFAAEAATREAALELEEARAKPDVEVSAGARYFHEADGDAAFLVGVRMPWPLFDRNEGNIRAARARLRAIDDEREAVRRQMLRELVDAHRSLTNAYAEATSLDTDLRPVAEQTLRDTEAAYTRGQFTILSVLESRKALFEVREAYLDALARYATALARIEALTRPAQTDL